MVKNPPANAGDIRVAGSAPEPGRYPGVGNSNPLQNSCQENSIDGSLAIYSLWGCKESDVTKLTHTHTHTQLVWKFSKLRLPIQTIILSPM